MEWLVHLGTLVGGLVVLGVGGEVLVRGAARLARQMGVSALVVGLTVVAFGTSAPEVAVSVQAAAKNLDDIAIANVVGSCIMNILVVLGIAALVRPLTVARNLIKTDAPVMVLVSAMFVLFAFDGHTVSRWQGVFFVLLLIAYTTYTYFEARREPEKIKEEFEEATPSGAKSVALSLVLCVIGLGGLVFGADLIVRGAVGIAELLGVSERIIGLTLVALGTSLPEIAICVIAARKGQSDIAIGNVVGSNIFNVLAVIGITATLFPLTISASTLAVDMPVMLAATVLIVPILRTGHLISRREGMVLLGCYCVYLAWLLLGGA